MSHQSTSLQIHDFGQNDPLARLPNTRQTNYLRRYLADLGAISVLEKPHKESGLAPVVCNGDLPANQAPNGFTRERFNSLCASLIRSGYPVLLAGTLEGVGKHAICAVGFRESLPSDPHARVEFYDTGVEFYYIHDDNLGPSVRFKVEAGGTQLLKLRPSTPASGIGSSLVDPTQDYPAFTPQQIVAAVHNDWRITPDALHSKGFETARTLNNLLASLHQTRIPSGLTISALFVKLSSYAENELNRILSTNNKILASVRFSLWEQVPPMSLHVGIIRIGSGQIPYVDILYDTSDLDRSLDALCHVVYNPMIASLLEALQRNDFLNLGLLIKAH